ncbi:MAG: hypothetical protein MUF81_08400 [Verrucomicrobia bacterium]|jgi:hypothetical protein|nr:hypothetical protein [Verrucomicrobiota bacterium]
MNFNGRDDFCCGHENADTNAPCQGSVTSLWQENGEACRYLLAINRGGNWPCLGHRVECGHKKFKISLVKAGQGGSIVIVRKENYVTKNQFTDLRLRLLSITKLATSIHGHCWKHAPMRGVPKAFRGGHASARDGT